MTKAIRALARGRGARVRAKVKPKAAAPIAKPKGGPVPGTPSPMRARLSDELQAHVRRLYETSDQPICQIALDAGIDESTLRRMGTREGWVRYIAPPRDLPPVATLLAEVERLEKASADSTTPTPNPSPHSSPDDERPLAYGGGEQKESGDEKEDNIARFVRIVMAHLDEFEAVRRDGKLLPKHHLQTARGISILTEAFNRLQRLRAPSTGSSYDDIADIQSYLPADLDAFRDELARQIDAFIASRTDTAAPGLSAASPTSAA